MLRVRKFAFAINKLTRVGRKDFEDAIIYQMSIILK
jgi:hypothetical protein